MFSLRILQRNICVCRNVSNINYYHSSSVLTSAHVRNVLGFKPRDGLLLRRIQRRPLSAGVPVVEGRIVRSPLPDLYLPRDLPLHQLVFQKCDEFSESVAFEKYESGQSITYGDLKTRVTRVASALNRLGLVKGDVILVCSLNNLDTPVLNIACSVVGVLFATVNYMSVSEDICRYLNETKPKVLFLSPTIVPVYQEALTHAKLAHIPESVYVFGEHHELPSFDTMLQDDGSAFSEVLYDPDKDIHCLPYSSGTSGLPKGIMTKNSAFVANMIQFQANLPFKTDDRILCTLPFYHMYGLILQLMPLYCGSTCVVLSSKFKAELFLQCIQDKQITFTPLVPPLVLMLAKSPLVSSYDLTSVKRVMCGAAPLGTDLIQEFVDRHPYMKLIQAYGMTETIVTTTIVDGDPLDSVGHLVPNCLGKIVDPLTNEALGPNQSGEVMFKGPSLSAGYFNQPEATKELLTEDGWLHTGDLGYYTEDGCFYVTDRLKEFIKYKGHQVAPAELEDLLLGHPDIQDAAVTRVSDEEAGEIPRAFIVRKIGSRVSAENICNFIKEKTSPEKWLRGGVRFIEEIPKNASGKILRRVLRAEYIDSVARYP